MLDKDKGGIFGFGILGSRGTMERCHKTERRKTYAPLHIDVDVNMAAYTGKDFDRDNWMFDNFENLRPFLEEAVENCVKEHGYPGTVIVHVRKTGER